MKGGRAAAERFMAGLKLASIATHVADAKTCVLHPASATHVGVAVVPVAVVVVAPGGEQPFLFIEAAVVVLAMMAAFIALIVWGFTVDAADARCST